VGLRDSLDTEARGKIVCLCWKSNTGRPVVLSVVRYYTDRAIYASAVVTGLPINMEVLKQKQVLQISSRIYLYSGSQKLKHLKNSVNSTSFRDNKFWAAPKAYAKPTIINSSLMLCIN
jgi:hypothetical protein